MATCSTNPPTFNSIRGAVWKSLDELMAPVRASFAPGSKLDAMAKEAYPDHRERSEKPASAANVSAAATEPAAPAAPLKVSWNFFADAKVTTRRMLSYSHPAHTHTLTITCTCCYDVINRIQDLKIYSHADSLIHSHPARSSIWSRPDHFWPASSCLTICGSGLPNGSASL